MKYLKPCCVLIISLLLWAGSIQTHAQLIPSEQGVKDIQKVLDKMKELKEPKPKGKGLKDDDPDIKELAKQAIHMADSAYKIAHPDNTDPEPEYDPGLSGEGKAKQDGKKVKIKIGPKAFTTPGWLASTKLHEFFHATQATDGRWVAPAPPTETPDVPGETDAEKLARLRKLLQEMLEKLKKMIKSNAINEVEAYDQEIENAAKNGLSPAEVAELKKRRDAYMAKLDAANQKKVENFKKNKEPYKTAMIPSSGKSMFALSRNSELFVAGTVLAEERMLVTVRGTKSIEGNVITAELNGKKTEARTNKDGQAFLNMSEIAGGAGTAVAVIKMFDSKKNEISSANTTVQPGQSMIFNRPEIGQLPDNVPSNEVVTITGKNLGADAHLVIGEQFQETLSASDKEITVFTDSKTGNRPFYVVTSNGVSQSQDKNVYSLTFALPQSSIAPKEVVAAQAQYESIPVGTKLIFTNNSTETVNMTIPGGVNTANQCIYTVTNTNGTIPVNVTGIKRGDFKIKLDMSFKNDNQTPR